MFWWVFDALQIPAIDVVPHIFSLNLKRYIAPLMSNLNVTSIYIIESVCLFVRSKCQNYGMD